MATSNENNVTLRGPVGRRLTFTEMDGNFAQLKNVIVDVKAVETAVAARVANSVYNAKMVELDGKLASVDAWMSAAQSTLDAYAAMATRLMQAESEITLLKARVSALEP